MPAGLATMEGSAVDAVLSASHDCAVVIDRDGVVVASNEVCTCGGLLCTASDLDLSAGVDMASVVGVDVMSTVLASTRGRVVARVPSHGDAASVEVTFRRFSGDGMMLVTLRDISDTEEEIERNVLMASEMRHRLGNAYAIAMAILGSSDTGGADAVEVALRRLSSLARVQAMARDASDMSLLSLSHLVAQGMEVGLVKVTPPSSDVPISVAQAQSLLIVVGELMANSIKHGAMLHHGSVHLSIGHAEGLVTMTWDESCPVPVVRSSRPGSNGFRIMSSMMRSVKGRLVDEWRPSGLLVSASFPVAVASPLAGRVESRPS